MESNTERSERIRGIRNKEDLLDEWDKLGRLGDIEGAIISYVKAYDYVSFVELDKKLMPFIYTEGDFALFLPDCNEMIVLWAGLSEKLSEIYARLLREKRIFVEPTSFLTYFIDGGNLKFPLCKQLKRKYKKIHWLPITLRVVPPMRRTEL